ncbi:MAG: putative synthase protein, partial [Polaromonas sp.]|nr:putative synthase protein [Polaromonas sp.]
MADDAAKGDTKGDKRPESPAVTGKPYEAEETDEAQDEEFKPLTHEQAKKVRELNPPFSLWSVWGGQVGVGIVVAALAWWLTGQARMGWSAGYGALAVIVPAALFARGLSRQKS